MKTTIYSLRHCFRNLVTSSGHRSALHLCGALAIGLLFSHHADAAFVGSYALNNFTLKDTSTCGLDTPTGSATTPDNGLSVILTGSDSGSGCPGTTDLTAAAAAAGMVHFQYSYSSTDLPGADIAGYLLGNVFTQLADTTGQTGNASFTVASGQRFGFRIVQDNQGGPGVLTVAGFTAPTGSGPTVPEPGTLSLLALSMGVVVAKHFVNRRNRANTEATIG